MLSVLDIQNIVFIAVVVLIVCIIAVKLFNVARSRPNESFRPHVGYPNDDTNIYQNDEYIYPDAPPKIKSYISALEQLKGTAALSNDGYFYGAFGYPAVYSNIVYPYYYDWPYDVFGNFMTADTTCENVGRDTKCYPSHPIKVSVGENVLAPNSGAERDGGVIPNNTMGADIWKCCRGRVLN